jgi:hypothetical protein
MLPIQLVVSPINRKVQVFTGNNIKHVGYELLLINGSTTTVRIVSLQINDKITISGENLTNIFTSFSTSNTLLPETPLLKPSESGLIYVYLDFNCIKEIPNTVENVISVQFADNPSSLQNINSEIIKVNKCSPIVVSPPLKGKNWFVTNGPSNFSPHRRAKLVFNGKIKFPELYALDLAKYGSQGQFRGDPIINSNFYSYGKPVYSVSNGKVIRVVDGIPDNIPGELPPLSLETVSGNYVLVKIEDNVYANYAHLIPGSLKVKEGDTISTGQILGLLGNSGNSTAPHLHFQITNKPFPVGDNTKPEPLNAQGVAWTINKFILEEYIPIGDEPIPDNVKVISKSKVTNQIPMDKNLVNF